MKNNETQIEIIFYNPDITDNLYTLIRDNVRDRLFGKVMAPYHIMVITGIAGIAGTRDGMFEWGDRWDKSSDQSTFTHKVTGESVTIVHNPQLDDMLFCGVNYPNSYYPITSFDIFVFVAGTLLFKLQPSNNDN